MSKSVCIVTFPPWSLLPRKLTNFLLQNAIVYTFIEWAYQTHPHEMLRYFSPVLGLTGDNVCDGFAALLADNFRSQGAVVARGLRSLCEELNTPPVAQVARQVSAGWVFIVLILVMLAGYMAAAQAAERTEEDRRGSGSRGVATTTDAEDEKDKWVVVNPGGVIR